MKKINMLLMTIVLMTIFLTVGCAGPGNQDSQPEDETGYINEGLLISVDWLSNNLQKNNVMILDARSAEEYQVGHIPGAINTPWQMFAEVDGAPGEQGWGVLKDAKKLSQVFSELGINDKKQIVVYADPNAWGEDGRIVWMLRMAGLDNSSILNGGWVGWKNNNGEISTETVQVIPEEFSVAALDKELTASTDWILERQEEIKIVDSRSSKEFEGAVDYGEKRGGHLPEAINIPFKEVLRDDATVKSQKELEELFTEAGLKPGDKIVVYCTAGIRSAHLTLMLRMAGFENARNYDASYYEWAGNEQLPLE